MKLITLFIVILLASIFPLQNNLTAMDPSTIESAFRPREIAQPAQPTPTLLQRVTSWAAWGAWAAVEIGIAANDPSHYNFSKRKNVTTRTPDSAETTRIDILDDFNRYAKIEEVTDAREFGAEALVRHKAHGRIISYEEFLSVKNEFVEQYPAEVKSIISPNSTQRYIQKLLLPAGSRIILFGDLHGNIQAFVRMLCKLMQNEELDSALKIKKPNTYLIFLGDIIDYGFYSVDTLTTIMKLKNANPENVFICRGNHEEMLQCTHFGFKEELEHRYPKLIFEETTALFDLLPAAIFIGIQDNPTAEFIQCCHGGIDNFAENDINSLLAENIFIKQLTGERPGLNLQWGDFTGLDKEELEFERNEGRTKNPLIPMYKYFFSGIKKALSRIHVKYIFRGHQDQEYAFKNLVKTFDYPINLFPVPRDATKTTLEIFKKENSNFNTWSLNHVISLENLWDQGIILGSLPAEVAPVFTFSNASLVRQNYDEGFGLLTINSSWEESNLKFFTHRPEIFNHPTRQSYFTQINEDGNSTISTDLAIRGISAEFIQKTRDIKQ